MNTSRILFVIGAASILVGCSWLPPADFQVRCTKANVAVEPSRIAGGEVAGETWIFSIVGTPPIDLDVDFSGAGCGVTFKAGP